MLWYSNSSGFSNRPLRGPRMAVPARPQTPPVKCTTPQGLSLNQTNHGFPDSPHLYYPPPKVPSLLSLQLGPMTGETFEAGSTEGGLVWQPMNKLLYPPALSSKERLFLILQSPAGGIFDKGQPCYFLSATWLLQRLLVHIHTYCI